jgi:hypothetical protein
MLDDNIKHSLEELMKEREVLVLFEREARKKLDRQIREHEEQIDAIRRIIGEEHPEASENLEMSANQPEARKPRTRTVTDEIRCLFEENPQVTADEVIKHVRSKFPRSKIGPQSFSIWNGYFKHGRYRMDKDKYYERYGEKPPYE